MIKTLVGSVALQSFETWILKKLLGIKLMNKFSYQLVFALTGEEKILQLVN